jgi:hypothetical protein
MNLLSLSMRSDNFMKLCKMLHTEHLHIIKKSREGKDIFIQIYVLFS